MKLLQKKGFTLIELLVVITIIGILATGGIAVYTSQIQKARDTVRIQDLEALKGGIEQIYQDKGEYPLEASADAGTNPGFINIHAYVQKLPKDPKSGQTCGKGTLAGSPCDYYYDVAADTNGIVGQYYKISTGIENAGTISTKALNDGGTNDARIELGVSTSSFPNDPGFILAGAKSAAGTATCTVEFASLAIKGGVCAP